MSISSVRSLVCGALLIDTFSVDRLEEGGGENSDYCIKALPRVIDSPNATETQNTLPIHW